ncbi:hypothetical protein, partial [Pseudomonas aeruginosa]
NNKRSYMIYKDHKVIADYATSDSSKKYMIEGKASESNQIKAIKGYKKLVEKTLELDPSLKFDYSKAPHLIILKDNAPLVAVVAPSLALKTREHYNCMGALFNSAFENKESYELSRKIGLIYDLNVHSCVAGRYVDDLALKTELSKSFTAVGKHNSVQSDFDFLRSGGTLQKENLKSESVYYHSPEALLEQDISSARSNLAEAIKNTNNPSENMLNEYTELSRNHFNQLKRANDNSSLYGISLEWLEQQLSDRDLRVKEAKNVTKLLPSLNDIVISDKYNKELMKFKTGGSSVSMNKSVFNNDQAIEFAAEVAFKNKIHPVVISIKNVKNESERGMIVEKSIEALSKFYDLNSIVVPSEFQHLLDSRKANELGVASFEQKGEEQEAKAEMKSDSVIEEQNIPEATPSVEKAPNAAQPEAESSVKEAPKKIVVNGCFLVPSKNEGFLMYGFADKINTLDKEMIEKVLTTLCEKENVKIEQVRGCFGVQRPEVFNSSFLNSLAEIKKTNNGEDLNFKKAYEVLCEMKGAALEAPKVKAESDVYETDISGFDTDNFIEEPGFVSAEETRAITEEPESIEETENYYMDLLDIPSNEEFEEMREAREQGPDLFAEENKEESEYAGLDMSAALKDFDNANYQINEKHKEQQEQKKNNKLVI